MWIEIENGEVVNMDHTSVFFIEENEDVEEDDDAAFSVTMNQVNMEGPLCIYPVYFTGSLKECKQAMRHLKTLMSAKKFDKQYIKNLKTEES